ncbi:hypothetical protein O181_005271 [Austropuccinia psidii MF-1]|uniref:Uncharacterized protein n=1 Tax=Austropuccinia psidii MF-1 TaxID=1389203 RepID=A0A9Q3BGZ3_9BASI|nr:hypothetical protein [Austropuccinia psidii MF-1]
MLDFVILATLSGLATLMNLPDVTAHSTRSHSARGHLNFACPKKTWLEKNPPSKISNRIQVAECAREVRLHSSQVQVYAYFVVDHSMDLAEGCPHGTCYAFETLPGMDELEISPDCYSYTWNFMGGFAGVGTREIYDHRTQESNSAPPLVAWKTPPNHLLHNRKRAVHAHVNGSVKPWPSNVGKMLGLVDPPFGQPKCGKSCEINTDPGVPVSQKGTYKPARAAQLRNFEPIRSKSWPTCPTTPDGKVKFSNPNPQSTDNPYCQVFVDSEACTSEQSVGKWEKPIDCTANPNTKGCVRRTIAMPPTISECIKKPILCDPNFAHPN